MRHDYLDCPTKSPLYLPEDNVNASAPMKNLRTYGQAPFSLALIHGGPGAPGHLAPVARELATEWDMLEPLQTAASVEGQIQKLREVLDTHGDPPLTVIGSS